MTDVRAGLHSIVADWPPGLDGRLPSIMGYVVVTLPVLPDGEVIKAGGRIFVGVDDSEPEHVTEVRQIVRDGLADVLEWLGEPVKRSGPGKGWALIDRLSVL